MKKALFLFGLFLTLGIPSGLWAQQTGYFQTNLVSNTAGVAAMTDPQLLNPWGISFIPGQDFWIANNNSGTSTLYDLNGNKDAALIVTIPGATKNPNGNCNPGCPTGNVANPNGTYFGGGQFIFDTEDGLITTWTGSSNTAAVAFDNSASGAVYKGLAVINSNILLAANFNSGKVDVFSSNLTPTSLSGSFTDPKLPAGYAPHGIHVINNQVYVAYAMQDTAKHDSMPGVGLGQVDIFDMNGNFVSTFVPAGGHLNAPWAVVAAPATFGAFPGAILVGNGPWGWHDQRLRHNRKVPRPALRFFEQSDSESRIVGFGVWWRRDVWYAGHSVSDGWRRQPTEFPVRRQHNEHVCERDALGCCHWSKFFFESLVSKCKPYTRRLGQPHDQCNSGWRV